MPPTDHWLIEVIGPEATRKLGWYFGGGHLRVPIARRIQKLIRDREIYALHLQGRSCPFIAARFSLSERAVRAILSRHRSPNPPPQVEQRVAGFSVQQLRHLARCLGKTEAEMVAILNRPREVQTCPSPTPAA